LLVENVRVVQFGENPALKKTQYFLKKFFYFQKPAISKKKTSDEKTMHNHVEKKMMLKKLERGVKNNHDSIKQKNGF